MGISIVVVTRLLEPMPGGVKWYQVRPSTQRALWRQPETTLSHGIDPVALTVFNRNQVPRLLQEFRFLAKGSEDRIRGDLEDAASFIESETEAIGARADCYVLFVGD